MTLLVSCYVRTIPVCVLYLAVLGLFPSSSRGADEVSNRELPSSRRLLEDELAAVQKQITELENDKLGIERIRRRIESIRSEKDKDDENRESAIEAADKIITVLTKYRSDETWAELKNDIDKPGDAKAPADRLQGEALTPDVIPPALSSTCSELKELADSILNLRSGSRKLSQIRRYLWEIRSTDLSWTIADLVQLLNRELDEEEQLPITDAHTTALFDLSDRILCQLTSMPLRQHINYSIDRILPAIEELRQTLNDPPAAFSGKSVIEEIDKELVGIGKREEAARRELGDIYAKLEEVQNKGILSFSSTNFMMLLLAFTFALTIVIRAIKDDLPLLTDQTLIEYGGMSFLILAIIILATADKIEATTVGPLLGTIAGYIFGKSVTRRPSEPSKSKPKAAPNNLAEGAIEEPAADGRQEEPIAGEERDGRAADEQRQDD